MLCPAVIMLSAKHQRYCLVFIRIFSQEFSYISSDMKVILLTLCTLLLWIRYVDAVCGRYRLVCLWVVFYVFDEWYLGKLRGSLEFLHISVKHISWMKRTSTILVNGEKNLIKSIIQRCLLVCLNMIINDCSSFVIEVPITSRARRYDPSVEPAPKRWHGLYEPWDWFSELVRSGFCLVHANNPVSQLDWERIQCNS